VADYRILIEADTAKAEKDLKRVDTGSGRRRPRSKAEFWNSES